MFAEKIRVGSKTIGPGEPVYIVAEIGINHNGDQELARKTIAAAKNAGVDAVKFQNYKTEDFLSDLDLTYRYLVNGREVVEPQYTMFKRCELSTADLAALFAYCDDIGLDYHSTPTSGQGVRALVELGATILKNGSDYLGNLELVRTMGETGLPVVLSTGMASIGEIEDAVQVMRDSGNRKLILLHCTSQYPTPPGDININKLASLRLAFGVPVGFSDHSDGVTAAILSVAKGACWIEKHFTLDKSLPGPDHRFSADPEEMERLVRAVREAELMGGITMLGPTEDERRVRDQYRLSCVAAAGIDEGAVIRRSDIVFRRPGTGIPPKHAGLLVGLVARKNINAREVISAAHFREEEDQ